jgi:putative heme-binding domain-containing protein
MLFFAKAMCHQCHTAEGRGGQVGPNLSAIGAIRKRRELLEAIVFPSATFARGYEPVNVELKDGRLLSGMMGRESADEIAINTARDNKPVEVRLRRADVESLSLGQISTMPQGLDTPLSPAEMSDLLAYLQALKRE